MTVSLPDCHDADLNRRAWSRRSAQGPADWPSWVRWNRASERRFTIGVEKELMLPNPSDLSLAQSAEEALRRLSGEPYGHTGPETHVSVIELATDIHSGVAGAVAELRALLDREPRAMGLKMPASAGIFPLACSGETRVSGSGRYGVVVDSMRMLARGESTRDWRRRGSTAALQGRNSRRRHQRLPER